MRILIADDEQGIAKALKVILEKNKFAVDAVFNGTDALDYIMSTPYDAIVLDIMMPGLDGLTVLKRAREAGIKTPVMLLTAKSEISDRVAGLESGADDYVIKPFSLLELNARVEALLRRAGLSGMTAGASKKLQVGPLVLDPDALSVEREGKSLRLNPTCFRILTVLMRASPRVVSREELESKVWSDGAPISDSLRSNLYLLRQALDKPFNVPMLKTHPGAGWSVCSPDGVKG